MNNQNNNEVLITEIFNASREKVFEAWTDPEKLMQWYAPDGCTISFNEINVCEGGKFHSCIANPQFGKCWCIGKYLEINEPKKLVFTMINADEKGDPIDPAFIGMDADWPGETLVTIILTEENGKTTLQLKQTVSESLAKKTGAYPSWLQMLSKMRNVLN